MALFFRQYQLACLSMFSYLIGDTTTGRAVVVDPQRDVTQYLDDAASNGLRIERVIETHFHADFLSGHLELAEATGASISYGSRARADFPIDPLADGQVIALGEVHLEVLHTPGHTPESVSIVVRPTADAAPWAVLSGDALFIGDVGRPDLLTSVGMSARDLAAELYSSLHDKLLRLPDETLVYPAHGAGSACGKHMSSATSSTIGEQRATNYALAPMSLDRFIDVVTEGQPEAPPYFAFAANANKRQRELLQETAEVPTVSITEAAAALRASADDAPTVVLDSRQPEEFATGHLAGSVNVGLDGRFAEYAGNIVRPGERVIITGGDPHETRIRLARIGLDAVVGEVPQLEAQLVAHPDLARSSSRLTATEADRVLHDDPSVQLVDVRNAAEAADGAIAGATHVPLAQLMARMSELDPEAPTIVYCASGFRSSIAASAMRAHGFRDVSDLLGGYDAWRLVEANR